MKLADSSLSFSYEHYRNSIQRYLDANYNALRFTEYKNTLKSSKTLILRHDIDKSTKKALEIAEIEATLGVVANYYVRLHSDYYNPFGFQSYDRIKQIIDLGHHVSLHSEALDIATVFQEDPIAVYEREVNIFEKIFNVTVRDYAPHQTHQSRNVETWDSFEDSIRKKFGHRNVYEVYRDKTWKYLSDSGGYWREGCFSQYVNKHDRVFVLTHPCFWFEKFIHLEEPLL